MAFCSLWFDVVLICVLCCYGGEGLSWTTDPPPSPMETPECDMYIRFPSSGNNTSYTVAQYLRSEEGVGCTNAISNRLRNIFSGGEESAKIRADLEERQLGNVCSAFVNIMSVIIFNNDAMSGGICEGSLFDDSSVDADFCDKVKKISPEEKTSLESNIESFQNYKWASSAARGVTTLQDLDAEGCTEKCGEGYSKVLCNAYYSIAVLFSQEFPVVLEARSEEHPATPQRTTHPLTGDLSSVTSVKETFTERDHQRSTGHLMPPPQPTTLPQISTTEQEEDLHFVISYLLAPVLTYFTQQEHLLLMHTDNAYRTKVLREKLSSREFEKITSISNLPRLLKLFWVVRVAGSELRSHSEDDFAFYAQDNANVLHAVSRKVKEDLKDVQDLGAVMEDVHTYREILFRSGISGTSSPRVSQAAFGNPWDQEIEVVLEDLRGIEHEHGTVRTSATPYSADSMLWDDYIWPMYTGEYSTTRYNFFSTTSYFFNEWQYRSSSHKGSRTLLVLFILFVCVLGLALASLCLLMLGYCCFHKWDQIKAAFGCRTRKVKYYRLSTDEYA